MQSCILLKRHDKKTRNTPLALQTSNTTEQKSLISTLTTTNWNAW